MARTADSRYPEVLRLRAEGCTFAAIAGQLGIHKSRAHILYLQAKRHAQIVADDQSARESGVFPDDTHVERLNLKPRTLNGLKNLGITTVGQVRDLTDKQLLGVANFGKTSLKELRQTVGY